MQGNDITKRLSDIPLFADLPTNVLSELSSAAEVARFAPGETVMPSSGNVNGEYITVILSGSVAVTKTVGGKEVLMRMLGKGAVSGVAMVYGSGDALSVLTARAVTKAAFISTEIIRELIRTDTAFAERFIRFLSSRIRFLNIRIQAYTCGSAEARLAFHIMQCDEENKGRIDCGISYTRLAGMLDISRASLYRAMDTLTERGVIVRDGREIVIKDRNLLMEIANGSL